MVDNENVFLPGLSIERWPAIDLARGIAILLVIYAHSLELFTSNSGAMNQVLFMQWRVIYSFHMPLFYLISGIVFRAKALSHTIISCTFLIIVVFFAHSIGWVINLFLDQSDQSIKALVYPMLHLSNFHPGVIWFLASLALVQLSYRLIIIENWFVRALTVVTISVLFCAGEWFDKNPFQIVSILPGTLFFGFGHFVSSLKIIHRTNLFFLVLSFFFFWITALTAPYNSGCLLVPVDFCKDLPDRFGVLVVTGKIGFIPLFIFTALTGSTATILLASWLAGNWPRLAREVCRLGTKTLDLLIINGMVLEFLQPLLKVHLRTNVSPVEAASVAFAFTALQIASLPILGKSTNLLTFGARRASRCVVKIFELSGIALARS